jgi:hypothetical protein
MNLTTVTFGRDLYQFDRPEPDWYQESPETAAECSRCGATLTFCFESRLNPSVAGLAATSVTPVAARCDCFLRQETMSSSLAYGNKLTRTPVLITPDPTPITPEPVLIMPEKKPATTI